MFVSFGLRNEVEQKKMNNQFEIEVELSDEICDNFLKLN